MWSGAPAEDDQSMYAINPHIRAPGPQTLPEMLEGASHHPFAAIRYRRDGTTKTLSHADVHRLAGETARGLIALGIEPGDPVAVLGGTVPEWTLADLGILAAGGVVIPIYHTNSPSECRYVLEHSGARAVFCEDETQLAKIRAVRPECPELEHVFTFEPFSEADDVLGLEQLRAAGDATSESALREATEHVAPSDAATIVYTSGTTGPPKGCILTHGNMLATVSMVEDQLLAEGDERPVVFMFLPLAHVFARVTQFTTLGLGGELVFWRGDTSLLLEDLQEGRPTHFPSVPRVFEKIHTVARAGLEEAHPAKRAIFEWGLRTGAHRRALERGGKSPNLLDDLQYRLADKLVFQKVQGLFGGRLNRAIVGAAPIGVEVLEFFDACGVKVYEGYGMTETCAATSLNTPSAHRIGSVGKPLPRVDVRIAGDGEILMRGPNVSPGYLHDARATLDTFGVDGWLRSGDLGELDEDGFLRITGRKKELIITSSGKNISPNNIETLLRETRWISQAVVYGDNKPYLVALLTIDPEQAEALAEQAGVETTDVSMLGELEPVRSLLREDVDRVNAQFAAIEQIKRFDVLPRDLSQVDGELTPTLKVKRALVYERYGDRFEALYRG
jgi:long-chain acyl-CoA synthetase